MAQAAEYNEMGKGCPQPLARSHQVESLSQLLVPQSHKQSALWSWPSGRAGAEHELLASTLL